jgi:hypothetical protein
MPHANEDMNVDVESYHANLKAILKLSRQKFDGRHVNWLTAALTSATLVRGI